MAVVFAAAFGRIFPFARAAVNRGVGVTASRSALREGGLRFSNQAYSQAHAAAVRIRSVQGLERGAILASRPHAGRIVRGPWGFSQKWGQVVGVTVEDLAGNIRRWDVTITTDRLRTRGDVIDIAFDKVVSGGIKSDVAAVLDTEYSHTLGRA